MSVASRGYPGLATSTSVNNCYILAHNKRELNGHCSKEHEQFNNCSFSHDCQCICDWLIAFHRVLISRFPHPRRPRGGRKGATKVFKHRGKSPWVPTLTGPFPNGQAIDWAQKCFVLLCPIGEQHLLSSFREFVHDGYWLDHGLSGSCTKEMYAVRKLSVWYKLSISKYCLPEN